MATFDAHKNFAISTVAVAPVSPTGGTSLSVFAGDGNKFPAVPFNAVIWPVNTQPVAANAEIVRVTNVSTDAFTITRNSESGGTSRSVIVGDQIGANLTAKLLTDIETLFPVGAVVGTTDSQTLTNKTITAPAISAPVLSGTATGTYTLAGTPTITAPAISAPVLSGTATGTYTLGGTPTITAPIISGNVTGTYSLRGTPSVWNVVNNTDTGPQNNWNPGLIGNTLVRVNNASLLTINGIVAGYEGQVLRIQSASSAALISFAYNNAAASTGNKLINFVASATTQITSQFGNGYVDYQYDAGLGFWRMVEHCQGAAITAPFSAGNFTATAGLWTVTAPNLTQYAYYLNKQLLTVYVTVAAATQVTAAGAVLVAQAPGGYQAKFSQFFPATNRGSDNGTSVLGMNATVASSASLDSWISWGGGGYQVQTIAGVDFSLTYLVI